ncbi:MAG: MFS transporter [Collinsella sp.]
MLVPLFSKPQPSLSVQAKHLVAMRFLIYTGFQTSYFIGVIGTLTYADDASVVATSLAVLFMNVFVILGSFAGGAALDAWGPRRHFMLSIVGTLATGAAIIAFGSATGTVLAGAALLGFVMGFAQPIATSYPAYLTDDPVELKDINSTITMFSNVSIIVGPTLGGFVAAAASSRAVFVLMMLFTALALIAGWSFKPRAGFATTREGKPATGEITSDKASQSSDPNTPSRATFATSIKTVFTNSVLALLFCIIFLSNFGYGAFDPLESFFYCDVLHAGVEWMGWLSSASGVGAVLGAVVALRLPPHLVNLKTLLVALMSVGLGSLLYVGTPYVGVALVGQIALGVAWGVVNPLHNTIVQTTAPLEQLGLVNSVMGFGNMFAGVAPLAIAPWLAAMFGVQQTLVGAGMVVTAVPAALLLFGRRHFDRAARQ